MTITVCGYCQVHDYGHNPFKSIGENPKILTLSDGRYDEIFEDDTLRRIGSVMFNTVTNKIQYFITKDDDASASIDIKRPKQSSRFMSVDPIFKKFPELCPYQFASLNPIMNIDLDGLEGVTTVPEAENDAEKDDEKDPDKSAADRNLQDLSRQPANMRLNQQLFEDMKLKDTDPERYAKEQSENIEKLGKLYGGGSAKIVRGTENLNIEYGGNLTARPDETITVLGRFKGENGNVGTSDLIGKPGINVLHAPEKEGESREDFYNRVNKPFINDAIKSGQPIRLISDPNNVNNLYGKDDNDKIDYSKPTFFKMELDQLKSNGLIIQGGYAFPLFNFNKQ